MKIFNKNTTIIWQGLCYVKNNKPLTYEEFQDENIHQIENIIKESYPEKLNIPKKVSIAKGMYKQGLTELEYYSYNCKGEDITKLNFKRGKMSLFKGELQILVT